MTTSEENRRETGITRIGTYLLSGWVLTDTPCSSCKIPTMRTKDRSQVEYCVLCNDVNDPMPLCSIDANGVSGEDREVKAEMMTDEELFEELENEAAGTTYSVPTGYGASADLAEAREVPEKVNISALLGQKLLKGWTMMQETCPLTCIGVPLMKNRKEELYCVKCESFFTASGAIVGSVSSAVPTTSSTTGMSSGGLIGGLVGIRQPTGVTAPDQIAAVPAIPQNVAPIGVMPVGAVPVGGSSKSGTTTTVTNTIITTNSTTNNITQITVSSSTTNTTTTVTTTN